MPRRPRPYQYQATDNPTTVASQYGVTPQALIDANPGGYPFSTGQTINIPGSVTTQFGTVNNPARYNSGPSFMDNIVANYNNLRAQNTQSNPYSYAAAQQNPGYAPYGVQPSQAGTPFRPPVPPQYTPNNYNPAQRGRGYELPRPAAPSGSPYYQLAADTANGIDQNAGGVWHVTTDLMNRIASNPQEFANLSMAQRESVMKALSAQGVDTSAFAGLGGGGNAPQSDNNWMTNPALHSYTWNRNAKNRKSTFQTNLKWAQNAWRRKRRQAKDWNTRRPAKDTSNPNKENLAGFGLVNFGASSG